MRLFDRVYLSSVSIIRHKITFAKASDSAHLAAKYSDRHSKSRLGFLLSFATNESFKRESKIICSCSFKLITDLWRINIYVLKSKAHFRRSPPLKRALNCYCCPFITFVRTKWILSSDWGQQLSSQQCWSDKSDCWLHRSFGRRGLYPARLSELHTNNEILRLWGSEPPACFKRFNSIRRQPNSVDSMLTELNGRMLPQTRRVHLEQANSVNYLFIIACSFVESTQWILPYR